jgi:hypothetical protein
MDKKKQQRSSDINESFLARWSRVKFKARELEETDANNPSAESSRLDVVAPDLSSFKQPDNSVSSKIFDPEIDEELRREMLSNIFHAPEYNQRDRLDDYDDNYTYFENLGDILTHEVKHAMNVLEEADLTETAIPDPDDVNIVRTKDLHDNEDESDPAPVPDGSDKIHK